ncbi:MAG: 16S rRNA (guanine(527)-N(7))-methyltransferase RsmG [Aquificaceae bacterium]|nr:16S rRNA (guanine(527)-N(7))-methyltransferase RsmG [Aquificaceae bacterium]MCS7277656.1 16S rRNA (guanine(527)-N(7))-methyltransferase RsmG [Aquificaceae bacterium]MDW8423337.1 16S rRNA (guanine(527)-N(7))-methyltransferase RsmG [Aquificaceae bacterium]
MEELFRRNHFELTEEQANKFRTYLEELKRWNKVHNLTAIKEDRQIVLRHFLDSLSLCLCLEEKGIEVDGLSVCDVGSGAGFPGVPLKIYYGDRIDLTLVEAVAKKCSFLEYLKIKLGVDYRVLCKEAQKVQESFDLVVSRALGKIDKILPLLKRLSKSYVLVIKGSEIPEGYDYCKIDLPDVKGYILFLAKTR